MNLDESDSGGTPIVAQAEFNDCDKILLTIVGKEWISNLRMSRSLRRSDLRVLNIQAACLLRAGYWD